MGDDYRPWPDVRQFLVGTPPVLGLAGVQGGVEVVVEAGLAAIREKAMALGQLAVRPVPGVAGRRQGFGLGSPEDAGRAWFPSGPAPRRGQADPS